VASLVTGGRTAPGDTIQGGDTQLKLFFWLNLEKKTLDKRHQKLGVVRRQQLKKVITLQRAMTKKVVSFFSGKNR